MSKEMKAEDELCLESQVLQPNKPWLQSWLAGSLVTGWVGGSTQEPRLDKQMSSLICIRICGSLIQKGLTQALILRIVVWLLNGDSAHY